MRRVSEAARELGLRLPVAVWRGSPLTLGEAKALYHGVRKGEHAISLSPQNEPGDLWHELQHAVQCERDFGGDSDAMFEAHSRKMARAFGIRYRDFSNVKLHAMVREERDAGQERPVFAAYLALPFEVEAREAERDEPLVVDGSGVRSWVGQEGARPAP